MFFHLTSYSLKLLLDLFLICKEQQILPAYHYVENQGKLILQSQENDQKPQFGQFFDNSEVKYPQIENFCEK